VKWFRLAAEQGYVGTQYILGRMYDDGDGVPKNDAEAVKWYGLAAEQGYADAQLSLGFMYAEGEGVPANYVEAYKWWALSAAQGNVMAKQSRDILRGIMTPAQIADGQKLAAEWKPKE
jgi:TPR repeat protein